MRTPVAEARRAGGTPSDPRCRGRIGVNDRPMKFTRKRTQRSAITPGSATTAPKPGPGPAAFLSAWPRSS